MLTQVQYAIGQLKMIEATATDALRGCGGVLDAVGRALNALEEVEATLPKAKPEPNDWGIDPDAEALRAYESWCDRQQHSAD